MAVSEAAVPESDWALARLIAGMEAVVAWFNALFACVEVVTADCRAAANSANVPGNGDWIG